MPVGAVPVQTCTASSQHEFSRHRCPLCASPKHTAMSMQCYHYSQNAVALSASFVCNKTPSRSTATQRVLSSRSVFLHGGHSTLLPQHTAARLLTFFSITACTPKHADIAHELSQMAKTVVARRLRAYDCCTLLVR